jgi:hypothetical protein
VNLALTSLPDLVRQSAAHAWLFIPSAMLLAALHGVELFRFFNVGKISSHFFSGANSRRFYNSARIALK